MEKYVTYESVDAEHGQVTKIIERPAEEQREDTGFYVDLADFPLPEPPDGMLSVLMVRLPAQELYYDYVEAPPSPADQIAELKSQVAVGVEASANLQSLAEYLAEKGVI